MERESALRRTVYLVKAGSHAYGTALHGSDLDVRGMLLPPREFLLGLREVEQYERHEPDVVIYAARKFFRLALGGNPGVLEQLFVEEEDVLFATPLGRAVREGRRLFLSRKLYDPFVGYATSQLKRMMTRGGKGHDVTRPDLLAQHGYDTKAAMHLIRLLQMGAEVLATGELRTRRPEAGFLLEIRAGRLSLEEVLRLAEGLRAEVDRALTRSPLPPEPDVHGAEELLCRLHEAGLRWPGNSEDELAALRRLTGG